MKAMLQVRQRRRDLQDADSSAQRRARNIESKYLACHNTWHRLHMVRLSLLGRINKTSPSMQVVLHGHSLSRRTWPIMRRSPRQKQIRRTKSVWQLSRCLSGFFLPHWFANGIAVKTMRFAALGLPTWPRRYPRKPSRSPLG